MARSQPTRFSSGKARAVAWGMAASDVGLRATPCSLGAGQSKWGTGKVPEIGCRLLLAQESTSFSRWRGVRPASVLAGLISPEARSLLARTGP